MRAQKPELVTAPDVALLTLEEVKEFLRLEADEIEEDTSLRTMISAAVSTLDGHTGLLGRALVNQIWRQKFDRFPEDGRLPLALGRVRSVDEVAYVDGNGVTQTFDDWHLVNDPMGPAIVLEFNATWPSTAERPDAITIRWTAGYGAEASDVPEQFRIAALQLIGHWYVNREAVSAGVTAFEVPWGLRQTIASMRAFGG